MNNQTRSVFASANPRVQAALQDYLDRVDKGEQIDVEAFVTRNAEIADELRTFIAVDQQARRLAGAAAPNVGAPEPDGAEGKSPQTKAGVSTHSVVGSIEGTVGGKPQTLDASARNVSDVQSPGELPVVFGRYRVTKKLGSGAMGAVYLADDTLLHRKVALKTPTFDDDTDGELLRRFYREARAVANLKHPNLCAVYDVGEIDGRHYISMEFVRGKKLQDYIKPDKPMAEKQVMAVVRKIALAMHEAHTHGVVHRDLKPDNIMVNEKGEPVVMDFGLVHKTESKNSTRITQRGMLVGSPAYMSKEQVEGDSEKLTAATDQYSLGVILYQLLTSKLPFEGGIHGVLAAILTKEPAPPGELRPDVNPHLEAICLKMMAKDAKDRYPSMKAVADAILEVSKGASKAAGSVVTTAPVARSLTDGLTATFAEATPTEPQSLPALKVQDSFIRSRIRRAKQKGSNGLLYSSLAGGVFLLLSVIFWIRNGQALVKVEVHADDVQVTFENRTLSLVDGARDYRVTPGEHTLHIKSNDAEFDTEKFTLKRGENPVVTVEVVDAEIVAKLGKDVISRQPLSSSNTKILSLAPPLTITNTIGMTLRRIEPGTFVMGSDSGEANQKPPHTVEITKPFYMGIHEVTQQQWNAVMTNRQNPWKGQQNTIEGDDVAASFVNWDDAQEFITRLNALESSTGRVYRMPTEAEWEYTCRAATTTLYSFGDSVEQLGECAWWGGRQGDGNCKNEQYAHRVGQKLPNAWGLYDMHGNVWEWCADWHDDNYFSRTSLRDPLNINTSSYRVTRGGGWFGFAWYYRSAFRNADLQTLRKSDHGFRVALTPTAESPNVPREDAAALSLSDPKPKGEPNNLLTAIDLKRDAISGPWIEAGGVLVSPNERNACVVLPVEFIPEEYQLTIEAERVSGTNNLSLFLVYGGKEAHVVLDSDAKGVICSGLNVLNGKMVDQNLTTWRKSVLPRGKRVTVVCTVRKNGIRVEADEQKMFDWNGDPGSLSHDPNWTAALPKGKFAIGSWESVFKVSRISLQPFPPADAVVFQDKRFKLFAEQLTWQEAQRKCRAMGGRLAEVRSSDENGFLMKLASDAKQTGIWLGATDEVKESTWLWSDDSGLAYNYFANRQPDRTKPRQHYLLMMIRSQRGQWCSQPDQSTEWTPGFICEWDSDDRDNAVQAASPGSVETEAWTELFNGHDLTGWVDATKGTPAAWKVQENYMEATPTVSIMTAKTFPLDFQLHAEFWIPKEDGKSGQGRGNSGIFLLGRHEIQILDMFENPRNPAPIAGLGALFNSIAPQGVVVRPPETWQTFDITFHAPRMDAVTGKKISGHLTLSHDGKVVIDNAEITEDFSVGAQNRDFGNPGPILLQGHVSPVRFRNIRIKELSGMSERRNAPAATSTPATTELKPLAELNTPAAGSFAWVSADGLRIYWEQTRKTDDESEIWQAECPTVAEVFRDQRMIGKGRQPTLTPDELQMVFIRSVGAKFKQLFSATRAARSESFSSETELSQFDDSLGFNSPFISADGLALYVTAQSEQGILSATTIVSRRPNLKAPWSMLRPLDIRWDAVAQQAPLTWLAMAPDELSFLATHELDLGQFRVVRFTRDAKTKPFEKFEYLSLPGVGPVYGRAPRYNPETRELFLTAPADYSKSTTLAGWQDGQRILWVIRNVDLGSTALSEIADSNPPLPDTIPDDMKIFGDHSYKFFGQQLTWKEAAAKCESLGGNLVIIDDAEENKFVASLIAADAWQDSWIGITDDANEGTWLTVNGQVVEYTNWYTNQPNNAGDGEHFAIISNRTFGNEPVAWRWCDQPAIPKEPHQAGFVCEWNSFPGGNPITKETESDKSLKWVSVFNGKDLTGWTPMLTTGKDHEIQTPTTLGWSVRKKEIVCETDAEGWLRLDQSYGDCEIELEFLMLPNSNSGLLVRCSGEGKLYGDNKCEIQLEHDYSNTKPEQACGGICGIVPPTRHAFKPNVWNDMTVRIQDGQITVRLNKHTVVDAKMADYPALQRLPSTGYFGLFNFMGRAKGCRFRNIRVKDLTRTVAASSTLMPPEVSPNSDLPVPNKAAETPPLTSSVSNEAAVSGWIDLLEWSEGIDWKSRGYDWNENCEGTPGKAGITLKPTKGLQNIVPLPAIIDGDYDLEVEFTRHEGRHSIEAFFPVGTKNLQLLLGANGGTVEGIFGTDGQNLLTENNPRTRPPFTVSNQVPHRIKVRVRRSEELVNVEVDVDDVPNHFTWSGKPSVLDQTFAGRKVTTVRRAWIGAYESRVTFDNVRVRMLSGTIQKDFITQADRDADLAEGFVRLVGEPAIKPVVGFSRFCINQIPMEVANGPEGTWPLITRDFTTCRDFYGARAPSRLKCPIPKGARSFTVVGYNDNSRSTKYLLYVDGKEVYASSVTGIVPIRIDLPRNAGLLELLIETGGNDLSDDSYWCSPRYHDVSSENVTDRMLDAKPRNLKFEIQSHTVGYGELTYNQPIVNLKSVPVDFRDAKPCDEFLYSVPNASVTYAVPAGMTRFTAIGYCLVSHSVRFEVWADARQIYASPQVGIVPIDVKLPTDTKTVELTINDLGNSEYDNAMWCYPRLHRK